MLQNTTKKIYRSEIGRWLLAALISIGIIGVIFLLFPPVFSTIDDHRLRNVYAGYASGTPTGNYLFCNVIWGSIISGFYKMAPGIPWYAIFHIVLIGLSSSAIGKTIYKLCYRKNIKILTAVVIHIASYLSLCCMATIMIHFEITSALAGTAAVALLLGLDDRDKKLTQYIDIVASVIFIFFQFNILKSGFYAVCCYLLVAMFYHLLKMIKTRSKIFVRLMASFVPLAAVAVVIAVFCNASAKSTEEWQAYSSYDDYRVSYWDYPHVTYKEDPELFDSIGWSEEFYNLVDKKMYFIDERYNEETLSSFVKKFSWFSFDTDIMFSNVKKEVSSLYRSEPFSKFQMVLAIVLLVLVLNKFFKDKEKKKHLPVYLSLLCVFGGTVILMCFLAVRGRFPLRAWLMCYIPFGVITLIQLLRLHHSEQDKSDPERDAKKSFMKAAVIFVCCFIFLNTVHEGIYSRYTYRIKENKKMLLAEEYCISNKDNLYVYDPYEIQEYSALREYKNTENSPVNMLIWGSSYIYTPVFYQQIGNKGYESFYTGNLFDENVYLIASDNNLEESQLFLYMEKEYPGFDYEVVDEITEGCIVIKLNKN